MLTFRSTLDSAVLNAAVPNGAPSFNTTFGVAGAGGFSAMRPFARPGRLLSRGAVRLGTSNLAALGGQLQYHVYATAATSEPLDYGKPSTTVSATTATAALMAPGTWRFGVRAFDNNGEEQNLDCAVTIVLDPYGNDITNVPAPPMGLRAFATVGGGIRVEWWCSLARDTKSPVGFHVYFGTGGNPNYGAPAATVLYSTGLFNAFRADLVGLSDGTEYAVGVRAYNSSGEESNNAVVRVTADASGPSAVGSLTTIAIV